MGFSSLLYSEIEAWARLSGFELTMNEVQLIKFMDMALVSVVNDKSKTSKKGPQMSVPVTDTNALKGMLGRIQGTKKDKP